ncbi:MAG: YggS family pyridoxal phosphate-dependent enzyme [Bacteroidales bacterium]|jgi:pyridoxal phosphate enzyme (YggS family)|nr:YggS family pyridoxal phosphate-dependent enzyme [Bacteroidales bacterium]
MIADNLLRLRTMLPAGVTLVAVSKYHSADEILQAYNAGQRIFGESRALEMRDKFSALPRDIQWHFIGHLQTNKVKYIAPFVSLIHSVDSLELLREINRQALRCGRIIDVLLEFHIASESTKSGFVDVEAALSAVNAGADLCGVRICGVMGMATDTSDTAQITREFEALRNIFENLRPRVSDISAFKYLSMGMSGDYEIALHCGSNVIRIGSAIFEK